MSGFSFLLDENVSQIIARGLLRRDSSVRVQRVGSEGMPPLGTSDPGLLEFAGTRGMAIVTRDLASFPGHVADHLARGRTHAGVFLIRPSATDSDVIGELATIIAVSTPEEWSGRLTYLPL